MGLGHLNPTFKVDVLFPNSRTSLVNKDYADLLSEILYFTLELFSSFHL